MLTYLEFTCKEFKECVKILFIPCLMALCASVFGFILKLSKHGWQLAISISILLPCNLPSESPVGRSQPEAN